MGSPLYLWLTDDEDTPVRGGSNARESGSRSGQNRPASEKLHNLPLEPFPARRVL
jgi:hypothetical protein